MLRITRPLPKVEGSPSKKYGIMNNVMIVEGNPSNEEWSTLLEEMVVKGIHSLSINSKEKICLPLQMFFETIGLSEITVPYDCTVDGELNEGSFLVSGVKMLVTGYPTTINESLLRVFSTRAFEGGRICFLDEIGIEFLKLLSDFLKSTDDGTPAQVEIEKLIITDSARHNNQDLQDAVSLIMDGEREAKIIKENTSGNIQPSDCPRVISVVNQMCETLPIEECVAGGHDLIECITDLINYEDNDSEFSEESSEESSED